MRDHAPDDSSDPFTIPETETSTTGVFLAVGLMLGTAICLGSGWLILKWVGAAEVAPLVKGMHP
ncbi:hypothetical protein [Mangrovicoccus algicola]|uniref:Uncharacterized protein n=1 Tax=Mangrovicoccus algicola TaxID=2771008 RepID=A0A8J6Z7Z5_9RHOB|nr:hypothetical protein [Mangrovicoccus algicola]MBE3637481.1 hypothetical protein [Mangrovicoccus algicola]